MDLEDELDSAAQLLEVFATVAKAHIESNPLPRHIVFLGRVVLTGFGLYCALALEVGERLARAAPCSHRGACAGSSPVSHQAS